MLRISQQRKRLIYDSLTTDLKKDTPKLILSSPRGLFLQKGVANYPRFGYWRLKPLDFSALLCYFKINNRREKQIRFAMCAAETSLNKNEYADRRGQGRLKNDTQRHNPSFGSLIHKLLEKLLNHEITNKEAVNYCSYDDIRENLLL